MKTPTQKTLGVTLVELLIAAGILSVLLAALTGLFVSSSKGLKTNKALSDRQQNTAVTEQVLKYELGLAGYRGVSQGDLTANTFNGSTLRVVKGSGSAPDTIRVQYYEDRLYGSGSSDVLRKVRFGIGTSNGKSYLTRRENGQTSNLVEGVSNLKVTHYIKRNGEVVVAGSTIPNTLVGLQLDLSFSDAPSKTVFISFQNPQVTSTYQAEPDDDFTSPTSGPTSSGQ